MISVARSTSAKKPGTSVSAKPGDSVAFSTRVSGSKSKTVAVSLSLPTGTSKTLTLKASAEGHTSTATVNSASGKSISLLRVRYTCELPPTASFCPASDVSNSHGNYTMKFNASPKTTVTVSGTVGPTSLKTPKSPKTGSGTAPAYGVKLLLRALPTPGQSSSSSSAPPPATKVSAVAGNIIDMAAHATGKKGSPQPLTITFSQNSGKSVTITGQFKGGKASTATVTSSSSPIKLTVPRYVCFVPPLPTFCPASSAKFSGGKYTVVFNAAPGGSAPSVLATVASG